MRRNTSQVGVLSQLVRVSWKPRKQFGPERPSVKKWTILSTKLLCTSQIEASTSPSPGQPLPPGTWTFEDWLVRGKKKSRSNAPPISSNISLLKDKFRLQSNTVHTFQREICRDETFKLLLKTLWKELFTNKGEVLSCKSIKPCVLRQSKR